MSLVIPMLINMRDNNGLTASKKAQEKPSSVLLSLKKSYTKADKTRLLVLININQLFAVGLYDNNIFYSWVVQLSLPQLHNGRVIVMDNAIFHNG